LHPANSHGQTHLLAPSALCTTAFLLACGFPDLAFDPNLDMSQDDRSDGASREGGPAAAVQEGGGSPAPPGEESAAPEGSGSIACSCSAGQALYPSGIACSAISALGLPPGQAKQVCARASGFVESAIPCGQQGTYVTCDIAGGDGQSACHEAKRIKLVQACHDVGGASP
jgi:hypothetical protein